jgi:hypothetical protein
MVLETLCFAVVALALAAPGLVVALMSYQSLQPARNDVSRDEQPASGTLSASSDIRAA